jgi:hypothetical protein
MEQALDESSIIQCQSVVDMTNLSMSTGEIIQPPGLSISETSIGIIEPKRSIVAWRRLDTSRISGIYEIDDTDLGVTKLDKRQVLYSTLSI